MTRYTTPADTHYPRFHARLAASRKIRPVHDKQTAQVLADLSDIRRSLRLLCR